MTGKNVGGEKHHEAVGENDVARIGDDAQAVAVAVNCKTVIRPCFLHAGNEVRKVLGLRRIGMMIGEGAVRIAIERNQVYINAREERQHGGAADAVSGIRHNLQAALNPDPGERFFNVRIDRVNDFNFAWLFSRNPVASLSAASKILDFSAKSVTPATIILRPFHSGGLWDPVTATPVPFPKCFVA